MTDFTAHDIHLIDQGAVDALRAVDALAADPETARRLAERGEAVYGAELTADLHNTVDGRAMSLAGWAAFATIRLVQAQARHSTDHDEAARMWAEDVDMVWAKVAERDAELEKLRAELEKLRAELADANRANAGIRAMCEAYKDQPPPIFQGPNLSEHGRGYNAGTRSMARAVLDAMAGEQAETEVAR